jgi:D-glycero-alpha-D-manno-heptose-7-phosphate kinase
MGEEILEMIESEDLSGFGRALDRHWELKKKLASKVSNPQFDHWYRIARANGALGGKISGAGGGGFLLVYTEKNHVQLREALRAAGLREMRYHFEFDGSKVLVNLMNGTHHGNRTGHGADRNRWLVASR